MFHEKQDTLSLNENRKRKQRKNIYVATVALCLTVCNMQTVLLYLFCSRLLFVVVVLYLYFFFLLFSTVFMFFFAVISHFFLCTQKNHHFHCTPVHCTEQRLTPSNTRLFLCPMCASVFTMQTHFILFYRIIVIFSLYLSRFLRYVCNSNPFRRASSIERMHLTSWCNMCLCTYYFICECSVQAIISNGFLYSISHSFSFSLSFFCSQSVHWRPIGHWMLSGWHHI